jgi:hypothetical protein
VKRRLLVATVALAIAGAASAQNAAQQRMMACNEAAGFRAGAERKAFMLDCLKKSAPKPKPAAKPAPEDIASIPSDWAHFRVSENPSDKELVAAIPKMKWWDACAAWGKEERAPKPGRREAALRAYLRDERLLGDKDFAHVLDRSVDIGMTECGVFASRGLPDSANHTTTSRGTSSQLVYSSSRLYVYTEESPEFPVKVVRSYQH